MTHCRLEWRRPSHHALRVAVIAIAFAFVPSAARAAAGWTATRVDSLGDVGAYASHVVDSSGVVHAAFQDRTFGDLKYARRGISGLWTIELIDGAGVVGQYASLALDHAGQPHVAYYDITNGDLKYASRQGPGAWQVEIVDGQFGNQAGTYASLAISHLNEPHIAYVDASTSDLRYATKTSNFWLRQTVDPGNASYASIALDASGFPRISYREATLNGLRLATRSGGPWISQIVDPTPFTGFFSSVEIGPSGETHIAYYEAGSQGNLRYARSFMGGWAIDVVDSTGIVGVFCSLALDPWGVPGIAYHFVNNGPNGDLRFASLTGVGWTVTAADTVGDVGAYTSIAFTVAGNPTITYYDEGNQDFMYADTPPSIARECQASYEWRRGRPIQVEPIEYWPTGILLDHMRPGDAIALAGAALDFDLLLLKCTDCEGRESTLPHEPGFGYPDLVAHEWTLEPGGAGGTLVLPPGADQSKIMYQMPKCGWKDLAGNYQTQIDVVRLTVRNAGTSAKVADPPHTGTRIKFTMTPCSPKENLAIKVQIEITMGPGGDREIVPPVVGGNCLPSPPAWEADLGIYAPPIVATEAPELCPDYVTLLSVGDPSDGDQFEFACSTPEPACDNSALREGSPDAFYYTWTKVSGKGEFVLGARGRVVAFRRSRSEGAEIRCVIENYGNRAMDPPFTRTFTLDRAKDPIAFVARGDDHFLGGTIRDLQLAYQLAVERYVDAGYGVVQAPAATKADVMNALKSSCVQAVWMTGHGGSPGVIFMKPGNPKDAIAPATLGTASAEAWRCHVQEAHPYVRELVALGCNTYSPDWEQYLMCGVAISFDRKLYGRELAGVVGAMISGNPYWWERDEHHPISPHNLSAP
jgi:hypothetical protein